MNLRKTTDKGKFLAHYPCHGHRDFFQQVSTGDFQVDTSKYELCFTQFIRHSGVTVLLRQHLQQKLAIVGTLCDTTTTPKVSSTTGLPPSTPCTTYTTGGNANGATCIFPFR